MDAKKQKNINHPATIKIPAYQCIKSDQIILFPITYMNYESIGQLRNDPEVFKYGGWSNPFTKNDLTSLLAEQRKINFESSSIPLILSACLVNSMEYIGECWFSSNPLDYHQSEIQFYLKKNYYSHPQLLSNLVSTVVNFLFKEKNKTKIYCQLLAKDLNLSPTLLKLGFKQEAYMKENIFLQNTWWDEIYYGLLLSEWYK